jgi:hypothetical protein
VLEGGKTLNWQFGGLASVIVGNQPESRYQIAKASDYSCVKLRSGW